MELLRTIFIVPFTNYPIITLTFLFILFRVFKPMKASDGRVSNTLTGLFCVTVVIFMVTIMDSINDKPVIPAKQSSVAGKAGKKVSLRSVGRSSTLAAKVRGVTKEKYYLLGLLWMGFACLYLLSHRGESIQLMGLRFMTALRGKFNPIQNEDVLDKLIIDMVTSDPSEENKEWAKHMVLAKKGVVQEEKAKKEEVLGDGSREGGGDIPDFMKG